ncbi:MAG TPA: hypothetical protein VKB85_11535 [Propionibacteriaceae bacterium]|nr:hypothetical protein [Propionibacteriaceae bacterium]
MVEPLGMSPAVGSGPSGGAYDARALSQFAGALLEPGAVGAPLAAGVGSGVGS